jgi:HlyD family secretion protein
METGKLIREHKKLILIVVIAAAVAATLGMVMRARSGGAKYFTAPVKRGDITAVVQATGTINPLTTVPVGSYVSGTVLYIFADFNSRVKAGQVLAQLDPAIYEAQVIQARGNLANAQANLTSLQAGIQGQLAVIQTNRANLAKLQAMAEYQRVNTKRFEDLFKQGIISQDQNDLAVSTLQQDNAQVQAAEAQLEQSKAQLEQSRAQLDQARAQVQVMTGQLRQAETNLRYTTILSPLDGTVVARNVDVGQSVAASLQAPNVFTIAQDLNRMQVFAKTDESDTGSVKVGTEATFQVDAFPADTFRGQVSAIRLNATIVQNVVTYDTVVTFNNPEEKLLPGETAYVTIPVGHASNCLMVPNAALRFTPDIPRTKIQELFKDQKIPAAASGGRSGRWRVVWKLAGGKDLVPAAIKTGITDYSNTQLLEGDLKEGDVLVTGEATAQAGTQPPGGPRFGGPR